MPPDRIVDVPHGRRPYRVWTLMEHDPQKPPVLPFFPEHRVNAFLEIYIHDWAWLWCEERKVCFVRFYSQCAPLGRVWMLFEYVSSGVQGPLC